MVYSRHFKLDDFNCEPVRKTLKPGSTISVFDWTKEVTPRRQLFKHHLPEKRQEVDNEDIYNEDPSPAASVEDLLYFFK